MAISEEELSIFIQHLVPAGRHNAQAVRFFRRFFTSLIANIATANSAQTTAGQAVNDAATAKQCAEDAQDDVDALELVVQALSDAFDVHVVLAAGPGVLGHVEQGAAVAPVGPLGVGAAPALYDPVFQDSQTAALDNLQSKIDALCASLQAAGVIQ